jgi:bifunctional DNase/RNase
VGADNAAMSGDGPGPEWVEMKLRGLIVDPNSEGPVVILREQEGTLYLPIWIGVFEANAIALAVEGVQLRRPLTHDLMRGVVEGLGSTLLRIEIHDLVEGTFYARLLLRNAAGEVVTVDARPSDAMALALRTGAPIWTARQVLDQAVTSSRAYETKDESKLREWLEQAQPEDFGKYQM